MAAKKKPTKVGPVMVNADGSKKSIADIIKDVQKNTGIRPVALRSRDKSDYLSTGVLSLDLISGGGYFGGRVIQKYGKSHTGKSSVMYTTAGHLHRRGVHTMFFDHEGTTSYDYALRCGFDQNSSSYYRPANGEETFETMERVLDSLDPMDQGLPQVAFIIDSIATMPTAKEQGEDKSKQQALRAAMHSKYMGLLKTQFSRKNVVVVAVNQIRSNAGAMYTSPVVRPGGNGWEFNSDNLFKVSRSGQVVEVGAEQYQPITILTEKNKNFMPNQECNLFLRLGHGIDPASDVIEFLKLTGLYNRPPKKAPTIEGLDIYADGAKIDKTFRSSEDLEETIRAQMLDGSKTIWNACEQMLSSGDAIAKYMDRKNKEPKAEKKPKKADLGIGEEVAAAEEETETDEFGDVVEVA